MAASNVQQRVIWGSGRNAASIERENRSCNSFDFDQRLNFKTLTVTKIKISSGTPCFAPCILSGGRAFGSPPRPSGRRHLTADVLMRVPVILFRARRIPGPPGWCRACRALPFRALLIPEKIGGSLISYVSPLSPCRGADRIPAPSGLSPDARHWSKFRQPLGDRP